MIDLIQLAVETTVREYTVYQTAQAWIGLACNIGVAAALIYGWRKLHAAKRLDDFERYSFTVLLIIFTALNGLGVYFNASQLAAPKAAAIHQVIKDIRGR